MDPDTLSKTFVEHYYNTFDTNRPALIGLYQEGSMLTFEGEKIKGAQAISNKLNGLGFQQCKHHISTVDCQPSGLLDSMIVFVSGNLQLPGEEHMLKFSQMNELMIRIPVSLMFHLVPANGTYFVFNDIFRLNYA
uniref:NTF2-related export protein n=1 Tax=Physcomitrium patens TaxID=3218 RepID=A0A7I4ECE9_PHYPA